jgi:hypothetical protein
VASSEESPGSLGVAGQMGGPRAGAGPKGRAVDRSLFDVLSGGARVDRDAPRAETQHTAPRGIGRGTWRVSGFADYHTAEGQVAEQEPYVSHSGSR